MKKILFSLMALVCSMSMNAQVMKVMKNGEVVKTYIGDDYRVEFGELSQVGFLLTESTDDDDMAAAEWFYINYVNTGLGVIVTPEEIGSLNASEVPCLWIPCDLQDNTLPGWKNLPYGLADANFIDGLAKYVKNGGSLLLTNHATQLTAAIGRIDEKYSPIIYGAGAGGEGGDYWMMQCNIGMDFAPENYDHRNHPIFAGLEAGDPNGYGFEGYYLVGPGYREDHNCMWDCYAYGLSGKPNILKSFEDAVNGTVLATWGHSRDYATAGVVEFNATQDYKGKIIAIGLSGYEFNQNSGNAYQHNIERFTANILDYLK